LRAYLIFMMLAGGELAHEVMLRCDEDRHRVTGKRWAVPSARNQPVGEAAPTTPVVTGYDDAHAITYLRLLDADAAGADWRGVARIVLNIDPDQEPERAHRVWKSHLDRAKWMTREGYKQLIRGGPPH